MALSDILQAATKTEDAVHAAAIAALLNSDGAVVQSRGGNAGSWSAARVQRIGTVLAVYFAGAQAAPTPAPGGPAPAPAPAIPPQTPAEAVAAALGIPAEHVTSASGALHADEQQTA